MSYLLASRCSQGRITMRYAPHGRSSNQPRATSSTICQKCLGRGHFTYECKNGRPYVSRPSRTQQLENPKLLAKFKADGKPSVDVPEEFKKPIGTANKILEAKEKERSKEDKGKGKETPPRKKAKRSHSRSDSNSESSSSDSDSSSSMSVSSDSESDSSSDESDSSRARERNRKRPKRRSRSSSEPSRSRSAQ